MFKRKTLVVFLALPALFFLAGCGESGTLVAGGGTGGTGISTGVIAGFGSVIVNDVAFDVFGTIITVNDNTATEDNLRLGMVAKIRGTFNPDGLTGVADLLDAENVVLGPISGFGPEVDSFTVLGQKIFVNGNTVFDNNIVPPDLSGLVQGDLVEVYGLRNTSSIRATRVEKKTPGQGVINVKGFVSNYVGLNTFNIGALLVTFTPPPPAGFDNGVFVEVEGDPTGPDSMTATNIKLIENAEFTPAEGENVEVEGFISNFSGHPGSFQVDAKNVQTTAATMFVEGTSLDLANDVRVEAKGVQTVGTLVAEIIEFE